MNVQSSNGINTQIHSKNPCNRIMFNFYTGLPHIKKLKIIYIYIYIHNLSLQYKISCLTLRRSATIRFMAVVGLCVGSQLCCKHTTMHN